MAQKNERVVNLAVRAKDEFSKVFKNLEEAGRKAQLLFVRDTRKALDQTQTDIKNVTTEIRQLTAAEGDNRQAIANLIVAKGKLTEKAATLQGNLNRVLESVRQNKVAASEGFAGFSKMADGMDLTRSRASTLRGELASLNTAIGKAASKQAQMVNAGNPFAAAEAGKDVSNYIAAARAKKAELRALTAEQHKASGAVQSNIKAWFQKTAALNNSRGATTANTAAVAASVPALKKKEAATERDTHAEQLHAEAMDRSAASARRMGMAVDKADARNRNKGLRGDAQSVEVFGLKPWQLTNLGYQINDVVSGFAMGQAPVQILAQQAGQFAQIWPSVMVNLARSIPLLAGVAAVLSPVIVAFKRAGEEKATLEAFTAELALSADGAQYSAEQLTKTAIALRNMGVEISKGRELINLFLKDGFDQSEITRLTKMAQTLSKVTGQDLADAAKSISTAFSGNFDSVRKLDRELNFLTASQLDQIRAMDKAGDRAEALDLAMDILRKRLTDTVQPASDWEKAVTDLKGAWDDLVVSIQRSGIIELGAKAIEFLAMSAKGSAAIVSGASSALGIVGDETLGQKYGRLRKERDHLQKLIEQQKSLDAQGLGTPIDGLGSTVKFLEDRLKGVKTELADVTDQLKNYQSGQDGVTGSTAETADETQRSLKNQSDIDAVVQDQLKKMRDQQTTQSSISREQFIQNALLDARNAALEKAKSLGEDFRDLTKDQTDAIRDQAGALFDAQESAKLLKGGMSEYVKKLVYIESSGNPNAQPRDKNGKVTSSALGLGQFIESTWLAMFKKYFPDRAKNMSREAILALRRDAKMSQEMIELYARENAKVLQKAGVAVNEASLYLSHFLGPKGAAGLMAARASTPVSDILSPDQISQNKSVLEGKTAGEVRKWAADRMNLTENEIGATQRLLELDQERTKKIETYNKAYEQRVADLQSEIEAETQSARQAAITAAIRKEEREAAKAGKKLDEDRRKEITKLTGELFDRQHAEVEVNALMNRRAAIMERLKIAQQTNDTVGIAAANGELTSINSALETAIEKAIKFWEAMGGPNADLAIEKLKLMQDQLRQSTTEMSTKFLPTAEDLNTRLADVGANAFEEFAKKAAEGKLSFSSFFEALRQGIGQFLIDIGKAIIKQAIFNALGGASPGGGVGGSISGFVAGLFHEGGTVGTQSSYGSRMVNPAIFSGAQRYHVGGGVGLKPGEVPIIAKEGEVIDPGDGSVFNKTFGQAQQPNVKVVNVLDPAEIFEKALGSEIGEKAFINFMARRSRQIKGVLG